MSRQKKTSKKRWVIKIGSNLLISGGPLLIRDLMMQVEALKKENIEVIWVTSGAIGTARKKLGLQKKKNSTLSEKQALSAIGQPLVMDLYNLALQSAGLKGAQVLLTYDDLNNNTRLKNFKNTIETLLKWNIVPVLNENDAVSTDEIKFGDNDSLSAKVAIATKADQLVILTDVDGVYDSDPSKNLSANRLQVISKVTDAVLKMAGGKSGSAFGTGGMLSKLLAAKEASKKKISTYLVRGDKASILKRIANKENVGTLVK